MPRVIHFEIPSDDPERAVQFYKDVFGWNIATWDGPQAYWLATTGENDQPGINGGIMRRSDFPNFTSVINTIDVPSVEEFSENVVKHGGKVTMPKFPVSAIAYMAYCQDPDGNTFGIMQMDDSAR